MLSKKVARLNQARAKKKEKAGGLTEMPEFSEHLGIRIALMNLV